MAALDPLGILNSDTQVGPDGVARRANEKVTRNYMQFGKYFYVGSFQVLSVLRFGDKKMRTTKRSTTKHRSKQATSRD